MKIQSPKRSAERKGSVTNISTPDSADSRLAPAVVHVDLDGATDIWNAHGWKYPLRNDPIFESGVQNILALLEKNRIRGTFFAIASSLDDPRKQELLQEIVRRGHEIASHSLTHAPLPLLSREQKRREIFESRARLGGALNVEIFGFRAPGYQVDRECLELLAECGYQYDSSAFPTKMYAQRLGVPLEALKGPHRPLPGRPLIELPLPDHRPFPVPFNPSYALLLGVRYFQWGLQRHRRHGKPLALLFHLIDVADPAPSELRTGIKKGLFTLSMMSSRRKKSRCQRILDLVRGQYGISATQVLLGHPTLNSDTCVTEPGKSELAVDPYPLESAEW